MSIDGTETEMGAVVAVFVLVGSLGSPIALISRVPSLIYIYYNPESRC